MDNEQCAKKPKLEEVPTVSEGKAQILVTNERVFYNPVQEFNRDLSVAVLAIFAKDRFNEVLQKTKEKDAKVGKPHDAEGQKGITILEALSATGLRSIRYAKEVEGVRQIVANDISAKAVDSIKRNVLHNGVENLVTPHHEDATLLMYQRRRSRFDAVDLDPYGCPSMYLDGAVQCVSDGGILLVTATDMAVLAGNVPETCYYKYGAISLKSKSCHEIALRILLQCVASYAGRYGRYVVPLLSISVDFYIRVFVKVFTSHDKCKENSSKIGMLYQCNGCESVNLQPLVTRRASKNYKLPSAPAIDQLCKHCQHRQHMGGPIWLGPLHDRGFVSRLLCNLNSMELGTLKRMEGVLTVIHEELDIPLYYNLDRLMSIVKCHVPPMLMFRSALLNAGYKVSYSHASKISIKTDAPNDVVWDIVRAWEKEHPVKREKLAADGPASRILNASSTTDISLAMHPLANPISRQRHLSRFQQNPTVNWGPGVRSRTRVDLENTAEDSKKDDPKVVEQAVHDAVDAGYRHFDCAYIYQNEKEIGKVLREKIAKGIVKREDLFITTKLWNTFHKRENVVPACRRSVKNFGLDYVDLYLIHWPISYAEDADGIIPMDKDGKPMFAYEDFRDTWRGMEECVRLGLTRSIGLSNFNSEQIDRVLSIAQIKPVMNQVECHPNLNQRKLRDFCASRDIAVTAYSPFGSPNWPWAKPGDPKIVLETPEIVNIGAKYGKTPGQVILRYLVDIGTIPIPKSVSKKRIEQNIDIFDFKLTPEEIATIDKFDCGGRVVYFDEYKVHKDYPFHLEF